MWGIAPSEQLNALIWARIYQLYVTSYGEVIFRSPEELKIYPCSIYLCWSEEPEETPPFHINPLDHECGGETSIEKMNPNDITSFMLVQSRTQAYKITLIGHDGTDIGKQRLFDKLAKLLVTPGYIFETRRSSISAKILTLRYNLMPILDREKITRLLDTDERGDKIEMTQSYAYGDPDDFVYYRHTDTQVVEALLFGVGCPTEGFVKMKFVGPTCQRRCFYV